MACLHNIILMITSKIFEEEEWAEALSACEGSGASSDTVDPSKEDRSAVCDNQGSQTCRSTLSSLRESRVSRSSSFTSVSQRFYFWCTIVCIKEWDSQGGWKVQLGAWQMTRKISIARYMDREVRERDSKRVRRKRNGMDSNTPGSHHHYNFFIFVYVIRYG